MATEDFGALSFPVEITELPAQGDPGLYYLADFIKTVANADASTAWDEVCRGRQVIDFVILDDPRKLFDESRLPALYCYQTASKTTQEAADILNDERTFAAYWIMEPAQEEHTKSRTPMANAVCKTIFRALMRGRHPAWKVDGDPDALAIKMGSWMWGYAGFQRLTMPHSDPLTLELSKVDGDGKPMPFYGLAMTIETVERSTRPWPGVTDNRSAGNVINSPPDELNPDPREVFQFTVAPS